MHHNHCPCGSGKEYAHCCEKYILGLQLAPTALDLMRSRYTAYVVRNADYLMATTHERKRNHFSKKEILRWASENQWKQLQIVAFDDCTVEFKAHFIGADGSEYTHHERSTFAKIKEQWFYEDGIFFEN